MFQFSKDIKTDFLSQIFRELFDFKTQSILLVHPVCKHSALDRKNSLQDNLHPVKEIWYSISGP